MNPSQIDKSRVALRFAQAGQSYTEHAIAQKQICQHLMQLMLDHLPTQHQARVLEIGCGSGNLSHLLLQHLQIDRLILNDIYAEVQRHFPQQQQIEWRIGDIEQLEFPTQLNLVTSSSALQWMTDLQAVFTKVAYALVQQGFFCFSIFGQQNLKEIKALTGQGLEYHTLSELQQVLTQTGFDVLHLSEQIKTLHFSHPKQVLQHLKATGVTATSASHRWTKKTLQQFYQDYQQFLEIDQQGQTQYVLSYHPIYCIARRIT
ncbi:malonyl-ACP O-methyltransferase BioC [Acinetobacter tandoii]|uniref:Malonyl-[acyl-carrier protein] O-methyltransferase n=1 Tax=Acinetobacter tandoii DSM 14970 = CIP 107469 TaxID=1120927 RepID=R9B538_9GAMM|nr:malonyl-ACP O-methyltransferase BioC [Acinetobacter tandoii]EOR09558.1 biotin biosynthesis protein BioC [Acinetobacter tandoii DSM 14970 = CIP 107469]